MVSATSKTSHISTNLAPWRQPNFTEARLDEFLRPTNPFLWYDSPDYLPLKMTNLITEAEPGIKAPGRGLQLPGRDDGAP